MRTEAAAPPAARRRIVCAAGRRNTILLESLGLLHSVDENVFSDYHSVVAVIDFRGAASLTRS